MTTIATASVTSAADPAAFFTRWADTDTWPEWNSDTEWVRMDGPFAEGGRGLLKPKGGPRVKFVLERLEPGRRLLDTSLLVGARLRFDHVVTPVEAGGCRVDVTITIDGPLAFAWRRILGKDLAASLQPDLDRLAAVVAPAPAGT